MDSGPVTNGHGRQSERALVQRESAIWSRATIEDIQVKAELGHYRQPGTTRQGTYCATPSGVLMASMNSTDPKRIAHGARALTARRVLTETLGRLPGVAIGSSLG